MASDSLMPYPRPGSHLAPLSDVDSDAEVTAFSGSRVVRTHTPLSQRVVSIHRKLEETCNSATRTNEKISPGLIGLRNTPKGRIRAQQLRLSRKHQRAQEGSDKLLAGGGISLWPEMDRMRLSREEMATLGAVCCGLAVTTAALFYMVHGDVQQKLVVYTGILTQFGVDYPLVLDMGTDSLNSSVLAWHSAYSALLSEIQDSFTVSLLSAPASYQLCVLLYSLGIAVLLLYLADNILTKGNLAPATIKIWVSLLVVMAIWTGLILRLFVLALQLERQVTYNVHLLNEAMEELLFRSLDLQVYRDVMSYWRTRCLSTTSKGVLRVLGVLPVTDLVHYVQYYSWPVITALLTPVAQLLWSLKQIYWVPAR